MIAFCRGNVKPFAAAIAAVGLIRSVTEVTGGDLEWWCEFIRSGKWPDRTH